MRAALLVVALLVCSLFVTAQVPGAPGPFICGLNSNEATLCFYTGANSDYYNISIQLNQPGSTQQFVQRMSPQTYWYFYNLDVGTSYTIIVAAGNAASGIYTAAAPLIFSTQTVSLQLQGYTSQYIQFGWYSNPNDFSYIITKRLGGSGLPFSLLTNTTSTYYVDSAVLPGTSYDYQLTVLNKDGYYGAASSIVTFTTYCVTPTPVVILSTTWNASIFLSWANSQAPVTGVSGYQVFYMIVGSGSWVQFGANLPATATSVNITGLVTNTTYSVYLAALNQVGVPINTPLIMVRTPISGVSDVIPLPPATVNEGAYLTGSTLTSVLPSWSAVSNAFYYVISCTPNYAGSYPTSTVTTSFTQQVVTGLSPNMDYLCTIYSGNNAGLSTTYNSVVDSTAITPATGFQVTATTFSGMTVSWNAYPTPFDGNVYYLAWFAPPYTSQTGALGLSPSVTSATISDGTLLSGVTYQLVLQTQNLKSVAFTSRINGTTFIPNCANPGNFSQQTVYSELNATFTWTSSGSNASSYLITIPDYGISVNVGNVLNATVNLGGNSGLTTAYILPLNSAGNPCAYSPVSVTTFAYPTQSPSFVTIGQYNPTTVVIQSAGISVLTAYQVIYVDPVSGPMNITAAANGYFSLSVSVVSGTVYNFRLYLTYGSYGTDPFPSLLSFSSPYNPPDPFNQSLIATSYGYIFSWSGSAFRYNDTLFAVGCLLANGSIYDRSGGGVIISALFPNNSAATNVENTYGYSLSSAFILPQPNPTSWAVGIYANHSLPNAFIAAAYNNELTGNDPIPGLITVGNIPSPAVTMFTSVNNSLMFNWNVPNSSLVQNYATFFPLLQYVIDCRTPVLGSGVSFLSVNISFSSPILPATVTSYTFNASYINYGTNYECQIRSLYTAAGNSILVPVYSQPSLPYLSLVTQVQQPVITGFVFPTTTSVNISWTNGQNVASYSLYYRSPSALPNSTSPYTLYPATIHTPYYYVNGLTQGSTYDIYISAYNSANVASISPVYYDLVIA